MSAGLASRSKTRNEITLEQIIFIYFGRRSIYQRLSLDFRGERMVTFYQDAQRNCIQLWR